MEQEMTQTFKNPIIWADYPDPDVIRVEDTYYMISTTMHFMPGGVILRSYDLIHWETVSYVYNRLEDTPAQRLEGEECIYGKGMWAPSLRYHKGVFYVCFVANDTGKTYLFISEDIKGPWKKQYVEGFYHDCSLLFDKDNCYIVYGNTEIYLTELKTDLSGPKPGGLHRIIVTEKDNVHLGYEGSHIYKINGKYYVFFIHWPADGTNRRVEACFVSDSLEGEFHGGNVLDDDMGFHNAGVAQGGIVDTPDGDWYAMLFQDHGAVGRIPVLVPVHFENNVPVFEKVPHQIRVKSTRSDYHYKPLVGNDDFEYTPNDNGVVTLKDIWQWNHIPTAALWSVTEKPGTLRLKSGKICKDLIHATNTLTQRMMGPSCMTSVTVNGSQLNDGDYAGICALQGCYGLIALTKEAGQFYLVMIGKEAKDATFLGEDGDIAPGEEFARIPVESNKVTLRVRCNFEDKVDEAEFYYLDKDVWKMLGITHKLFFKLDHFVGCRIGLFMFSTKETKGVAEFTRFRYK